MSRDNRKKRKTSSLTMEEYAQQLRRADNDVDREKREYAGHKIFGHHGEPNVGVSGKMQLVDYSVADIEDALNNPPPPLPLQNKKRKSRKSRGGKSKKNKANNAKSKKYRRT